MDCISAMYSVGSSAAGQGGADLDRIPGPVCGGDGRWGADTYDERHQEDVESVLE